MSITQSRERAARAFAGRSHARNITPPPRIYERSNAEPEAPFVNPWGPFDEWHFALNQLCE